MRTITTIIFLLYAYSASAFCIQSRGYDFQSSVNGAVKWLACLHDEQTTTLNDHARIINNNTSDLSELKRSKVDTDMSMLSVLEDNRKLKVEAERAQINIQDLKRAIADLTARLEELEKTN